MEFRVFGSYFCLRSRVGWAVRDRISCDREQLNWFNGSIASLAKQLESDFLLGTVLVALFVEG